MGFSSPGLWHETFLVLGAVRNYQGGRVANNAGRVSIFVLLKREGYNFSSCLEREGHDFSGQNLE